MAESAKEKELEKQTLGFQHEIQEPHNELPNVADTSERLRLRETVDVRQQDLSDQKVKLEDAGDDLPEGLHLSEHAQYPSEKMPVLREQEAKKRKRGLSLSCMTNGSTKYAKQESNW